MAYTNFTGPVRSDEGFEQLVDGVWTPVGSGGGGGGSTATMFTTPTDGSNVTVTLPAPTEAGTMYTVAGTLSLTPSGTVTIATTLLPGQAVALLVGVYISAPDNINSLSGEDTYTSSVTASSTFQIVYLGAVTISGSVAAVYSVVHTAISLG